MSKSPLRYKKLIQELPKHKNATDAIVAAGFSRNTANKQQKRVLQATLKHQAREILGENKVDVGAKQLMSDIVGLSSETLFERIRFIATQEKDLASALKVLVPLLKQHNVQLSAEEAQNVTVPILNVVVKENENGSTEPFIDVTQA